MTPDSKATRRRINAKKWYDRLRAAGMCISCRKPSGGRVHCPTCSEERNRIDRQIYAIMRMDAL